MQPQQLSPLRRKLIEEALRRGLALPPEALHIQRPRQIVEQYGCELAPTWFHPDQAKAWESDKPIIAICAGWQSGKTVFLPPWLKREIQRKGPGDYGAFSSTYKLLSRKFLPELRREFKDLAVYRSSEMRFEFTEKGSRAMWGDDWSGEPTVIQLGYAENPDSLESATLKAVIWDEPGQRSVPEQSYRTVESRLMVNRGRMALASRPYESNWYERLVVKPNPNVCVVNFPSWANPVNPQEADPYWDDKRLEMPAWLFDMLYRGLFTRPAGSIYDCFDYDTDTCNPFDVSHLPHYAGVDFGNVNMGGVIVVDDEAAKCLYVIDEYHANKTLATLASSAAEARQLDQDFFQKHTARIKKHYALKPGAGGSHQEEGWREAFRQHGLPLDEPPVNDVEVQIACVYSEMSGKRLKIFRTCKGLISEIGSYARELDDEMNPTEKIADKAKYHRLDALRYIVTKLRPPKPRSWVHDLGKLKQG